METYKYFRLYAHNIPVKGKERSAIYNLEKGQLLFIPNVFYQVLHDLDKKPVREVINSYAPLNPGLLDPYFEFLLKKDLGFFTDHPENFTPLNLTWSSPHLIQTAVVEYNFTAYPIQSLFNQLDALLCRHLELRVQVNASQVDQLLELVQSLRGKALRSIAVLIPYFPQSIQNNFTETLFEACSKIEHILVYKAPFSGPGRGYPKHIAFTEADIQNQPHSKTRHIVNFAYFAEAQHHHPYYNRKVCIDRHGFVKNCLLLEKTFGRVGTDALEAVVQRPDFQELWHASPDKIADLKDSALRYCIFEPQVLEKDHASGLYRIKQATPEPVACVA